MTKVQDNEAFVRLYQSRAGLVVDGHAGEKTLRSLDEALPPKVRESHTLKDEAAFFQGVRAVTGSLTQSQVDGIKALVKAMASWPVSWVAYGLATAYWETAQTFQPIKERGGDAYFKRMYDPQGERPHVAKDLGNTQPGDGVKYAGRGYAMITGRANYRKFGIENDPDKALLPDVAADILVRGMEQGMFTGKKNADYLPGDYVEARRIINRLDQAHKIEGYARSFESALTAGGWG